MLYSGCTARAWREPGGGNAGLVLARMSCIYTSYTMIAKNSAMSAQNETSLLARYPAHHCSFEPHLHRL